MCCSFLLIVLGYICLLEPDNQCGEDDRGSDDGGYKENTLIHTKRPPLNIYTITRLMDLNTFLDQIKRVQGDRIRAVDFMNAFFAATNIDDDTNVDVAINRAQCLPRSRIVDIAIDIMKWVRMPTPVNKQIAFASLDSWLNGYPDPWESI